MAKASKPQGKRSVCIKAMFSKAGNDALRATKTGKGKASKVSKSSKHSKANTLRVPEHALSNAFSDSIEESREHIYDLAANSLAAAYMALSQHLKEIDEQHAKEEQALVESLRMLHVSFKTEEIEFRSEDGKQTGVVALSHRMKKVQKTVDTEEKELTRQYNEWLEVEAEIDSLAAEFAVANMPNAMGVNLPDDIVSVYHAELMRQIEEDKAYIKNAMEETAEASIKDMTECEKELKLKEKIMHDQFSALLYDDEY